MSVFDSMFSRIFCLVCFFQLFGANVSQESRPYEFSFNIVDFQHRYEKKDENGLISGEYGFITADGVYHETGYATDKNGDFIITKMRNRKINSLKDAQEIFKDRPEAAKKLVEAVAKACGGCKIPIKQTKPDEPRKPANVTGIPVQKKMAPILEAMTKTLMDTIKTDGPRSANKKLEEKKDIVPRPKEPSIDSKPMDERTREVIRNMVNSGKKLLAEEEVSVASDGVLEKMANDLYYRFNYTITSHGHQEDGYKDGRKDGGYRAQSENGVDTEVKYLSNEFGHQPNITFVPRGNSTEEGHALKGYSFLWYWL